MGYFNIIDSLKNSRIEEGMMTSISANKSFVGKSVLSALVVGDYSLLPKKDVKIIGDSDFFNKSPIKYATKLVQLVSIDMLDIANHKVRFLSYGVGNVKYIVIMYLNVTAKSSFEGTTFYDSDRDVYCTSTKEALDMIFSYCADLLCGSLSGFNSLFTRWLSNFESCRLDITSSKEGLGTSALIYLYGDKETLDGFSDEVCVPMDKTRFHATTSTFYGYVVFTFNL